MFDRSQAHVGIVSTSILALLASCSEKPERSAALPPPSLEQVRALRAAPPQPAWDPVREFALLEAAFPESAGNHLGAFYQRWGAMPGAGADAVQHAAARGKQLAGNVMGRAFAGWLATEPAGAREWVLAMDAGRRQTEFARALATALPGAAERAAWADTFGDGATRRLLLSRALVEWGRTDPEAGLRWLEQRRDQEAAPAEVGQLVRAWVDADSFSASRAIGEMPDGELRDQAVAAMVVVIASGQPEAARQWAQTIGDRSRRDQALAIIDHSSATGPAPDAAAGG